MAPCPPPSHLSHTLPGSSQPDRTYFKVGLSTNGIDCLLCVMRLETPVGRGRGHGRSRKERTLEDLQSGIDSSSVVRGPSMNQQIVRPQSGGPV